MFILITSLILVVTALTVLILRIVVPGFRYHWLFAVGGSLLAWISAFAWLTGLPVSYQLPGWQPEAVFSQSPVFVADQISWAFAVSLLTLCLAIILTAVIRPQFPSPVNWVGTLTLTSLGVLAVVAGNPLTLVIIWAAIDLVELVVQLWFVEDPKLSERVVISFASRVTGILILLWADMVGAAGGQISDFRAATPQAGLFLLIAAGLRLGVLPLHLPYTGESSLRRGFGTGLRMISAASSLILLARIPAGSIHSPFTPYLLMLVSFAAVYGGWTWLRAPDELTARPFWLIGMGSLGVAAALRSDPVGAAAWSCALILAGSALFLFSSQNKWLTPRPVRRRVRHLGPALLPDCHRLGQRRDGLLAVCPLPAALACHADRRLSPPLAADAYAQHQPRPTDLGQERLPHRHHAPVDHDGGPGIVRLGGGPAGRQCDRQCDRLSAGRRSALADPAGRACSTRSVPTGCARRASPGWIGPTRDYGAFTTSWDV